MKTLFYLLAVLTVEWNVCSSKITSRTLCSFVFLPTVTLEITSAQEKQQDANVRLVHRLMMNYQEEKQILPAPNGSKPVIVTFDMAFSQLVDLVGNWSISHVQTTSFCGLLPHCSITSCMAEIINRILLFLSRWFVFLCDNIPCSMFSVEVWHTW